MHLQPRWDEEFYRRFEDVLGRIPRWDLERDFFTAVLEKPGRNGLNGVGPVVRRGPAR